MSDGRWLELAGPVEDDRTERRIPVRPRFTSDKPWNIVVGGSRSKSSLDSEWWGCVYLYIGPLTLYFSEAKARTFDWEVRNAGTVIEDFHWSDYRKRGGYPMLSLNNRALAMVLKAEIRRAGRIASGLEPSTGGDRTTPTRRVLDDPESGGASLVGVGAGVSSPESVGLAVHDDATAPADEASPQGGGPK